MNTRDQINSQSQLVIIGAGGHAVSVAETVVAAGNELVAFVSSDSQGQELLGRPVFEQIPENHITNGGFLAIAIGDNSTRERVWHKLRETIDQDRFPTLIHPSSSVSQFAVIGAGTVVLQGAIVGSSANVGVGCLLNSGSITEHECKLGDFASLGPNTTLGGRVTIGQRSAISIGATVKHGVHIGNDTVVGAQSYVHSDLGAEIVAFGIPARVQRTRQPTDLYLT
jgi:sugar O-acyltransferase (sialic acid O-acetyltransferase NeuD family)